MKDAVATMGTILPANVDGRDAVHVAVIAVRAAGPVWAGSDLGIQLTDNGYIASRNLTPHIGIVDPFLKRTAEDGQRFWLFLYPRTITGLAHTWSHPAFPETQPTDDKAKSENWLREFIAKANCPDYETMMSLIKRIANGETSGCLDREEDDDSYFRLEHDYLHFNGADAHGKIPPEFWDHASIVAGKTIKGVRPEYFSCSC